jgi:hypothetical protein
MKEEDVYLVEDNQIEEEVEEMVSLQQKAMQKVIDKIIPKQLQEEDFRFVKIKQKGEDKFEKINDEWHKTGECTGKEPYVRINGQWNWRKYNYSLQDKDFISYLRNCHAYGIICGYGGLVIVDYDDVEYMKQVLPKLQKQLPTFMVKTGSGKAHAYYKVKGDTGRKVWHNQDGDVLIELRGEGGQCLAPGSLHPSGEYYRVFKDIPIMELDSLDVLKDFIKPYMPEIIKDNVIFLDPKDDRNISKEDEIFKAQLYKAGFRMADALTMCNIAYRNPTVGHCEDVRHSSKGGKPMHYTEYGWTCFHCRDAGDFYSGNPFEYVAAAKGLGMTEAYYECARYKGIALDEWYEKPAESGFDEHWESMEAGMMQEHREVVESSNNEDSEEPYKVTIIHNTSSFKARTDIEESTFWCYPIVKSGGHRTSFTGPAGTGKTAAGLKLFNDIGNHETFLCWSTETKRPKMVRESDGAIVDLPFKGLYLDFEMSAGELQEKLPFDPSEAVDVYCLYDPTNEDIYPEEALLMDVKYREIWKQFIIDNRYNMVAFDNIFSAFPGREENSTEAYSPINTFFNQLRAEGVHVWEVHHTGKDGSKGIRGTSAAMGNINTAYQLKDMRDQDNRGDSIWAKWMVAKYRIYVPRDDNELLMPKEFKAEERESGTGEFEWNLVADGEADIERTNLRTVIMQILHEEPNISMTDLHMKLRNLGLSVRNRGDRKVENALVYFEDNRFIKCYRKDRDTGEYIPATDHRDKFESSSRLNERRELTNEAEVWLLDQ